MLSKQEMMAWAQLQLVERTAEVFDGFDSALADAEAAFRYVENKRANSRTTRKHKVVGFLVDFDEAPEPLDFN